MKKYTIVGIFSYWSFSPSIMGKSAAVVGNVSKYLDCRNVDYKLGVRPAIALSSEAIITSGDGTVDNPFIVE